MRARLLILVCACNAAAFDSLSPLIASADDATGARRGRAAFVAREIAGWNSELSDAERAEKYAKLKASPLDFFRGTNHLVWVDHVGKSELQRYGAEIWLSGDLHTENLGAFNDDTGAVVFGMNDYDESVIGDYQLDVWRLAISLVLEARAAGLGAADIRAGVERFAEAYLEQLDDDRHDDDEGHRRFTVENSTGAVAELIAKEAKKNHAELLAKWTSHDATGARIFAPDHADLKPLDAALSNRLREALTRYTTTLHEPLPAQLFVVKSLARRVHAGLGSLSVDRYYALIEGSTVGDDDDEILDIKAQPGATGSAYLDGIDRAEGERVAVANRALDVHVDGLVGWLDLDGASFSVHALTPAKGSLPRTAFAAPASLTSTAEQLGRVLATFHARADKDFDSDWIPFDFEKRVHDRTDGEHVHFRDTVWHEASTYANQVAKDWASFMP